MKPYHVYAVGNALVDMEYEINDADLQQFGTEKGVMTLIDEERHDTLEQLLASHPHKRACGGSAANTVIAVAQLGGKAYYSCKVGNDEGGDFYLRDLDECGVKSAALGRERDAGTTGKCLVMITPDAERTMNTYLGITGELSADQVNEEALAASEYVYIEGYLVTSDCCRAAAIRVRDLARKHGVKVAMTFSDPAMVEYFKDGVNEVLGKDGVDLLFCNEQEACTWAGTDNLDDAIASLKLMAKQLVVTLGSKGAVAWDGNTLHEIAPHEVTAVDSNGAGDLFAGAFMYAITHGHDFAAAGRLASAASAQIVSQFGPRLEPDQYPALKDLL